MATKTITQRIQSDLEEKGQVMLADYKGVTSFRNRLYDLKGEGWKVKRIGKVGNIKGYELIEKPSEVL